MVVKVFVLGCPGTGKSTAARLMMEVAREHRWHALHIDDYNILQWMFEKDHSDRFEALPLPHKGFKVVDFLVYDEALGIVRDRVMHSLTQTLWTKKLVLIEFARSGYSAALEKFGANFLQESYFLFLKADADICFERVEWRVNHRQHEEDHFVAKETIERLCADNDIDSVTTLLKTRYHLDERHIKVLDNIYEEQDFRDKVREFIEGIIELEKNKQI